VAMNEVTGGDEGVWNHNCKVSQALISCWGPLRSSDTPTHTHKYVHMLKTNIEFIILIICSDLISMSWWDLLYEAECSSGLFHYTVLEWLR
jgi:hypothetical protein